MRRLQWHWAASEWPSPLPSLCGVRESPKCEKEPLFSGLLHTCQILSSDRTSKMSTHTVYLFNCCVPASPAVLHTWVTNSSWNTEGHFFFFYRYDFLILIISTFVLMTLFGNIPFEQIYNVLVSVGRCFWTLWMPYLRPTANHTESPFSSGPSAADCKHIVKNVAFFVDG